MIDIETINYGVFLENANGETCICATDNIYDAENFYNKQINNWIEQYKGKEIDNNDKLSLKNISEDFTIRSCSLFDLI